MAVHPYYNIHTNTLFVPAGRHCSHPPTHTKPRLHRRSAPFGFVVAMLLERLSEYNHVAHTLHAHCIANAADAIPMVAVLHACM